MNLVIANTNATAFAVSRALNCTDRTEDGYYTNDTMSIIVAHVAPDMVAPNTLQDYTGGSDFTKELPFVPTKHLYHVKDKKAAERIFALMRQADEVVFASNGGCIEQGMFDMLCQSAKVGRKRSRMWLTSLTNKAINHAYRYRTGGRGLYRLARAGNAMMACDNLFEINFGGTLAQAYGKGAFPLRRPDTSILWTLCELVDSRKKFRQGDKQYTFGMTVEYAGLHVKLCPANIWDDESVVLNRVSQLRNLMGGTLSAYVIDCSDVESQELVELFTHSTLQTEAMRQLGFMPAKTNALANALYEKGLISSPLTSVAELPKRMKDSLTKRYPGAKHFPYEDNSVCRHSHGIITTGRNPIFLSSDEEWLYGFIAKRVEQVFSQKRTERELVLCVPVANLELYGSAIVPDDFYIPEGSEIEVKVTGVSHSSFSEKHLGNVVGADFLETIYEYFEMEAGDDYPVCEYADMGLALQRLIDNGFVESILGELFPTEKARLLMALTRNTDFGCVGTVMSQIGDMEKTVWDGGTLAILHKYEDWLSNQIITLITDTAIFCAKPMAHRCPKCGQVTLTEYPMVISCSHCNFALPKQFRGYDFTAKDINQLLTHRYTSPIYGLKGRKGRKYCDALVLDARFRLTSAPAEASILS